MKNLGEIRICMDIGSNQHQVLIGLDSGEVLDEFNIAHNADGINHLLSLIEQRKEKLGLPVAVAMEAYNGYARPIDQFILSKGYKLLNVNNHKLASFKKVFPGAAKNDIIDTRKIFELFTLHQHLPLAKNVLQEVIASPEANEKLKYLTRRRRSLVNEQVRIVNRLQSDIQAVAPGLLAITKDVCNLWFLNFITNCNTIEELVNLDIKALRAIKGVGAKFATDIVVWQQSNVPFSLHIKWRGEMIVHDAKKIIVLRDEIKAVANSIENELSHSPLAQRINSIPGFGEITSGEIAGEIGNMKRFKNEGSLALYLGMCVLDNSSGKYKGTKDTHLVNKRAKMAMMYAVARHIDHYPPARKFYDKKRVEGKKHNQAVRALGRYLIRTIWSLVKHNRQWEAK